MTWKRIVGMRDKMIHDYFGVNLELVWHVVVTELLGLQAKITKMIAARESHGS